MANSNFGQEMETEIRRSHLKILGKDIWGLRPFQENFTNIEPIINHRWTKSGVPGEKPTGAELGISYVSRARLEPQRFNIFPSVLKLNG